MPSDAASGTDRHATVAAARRRPLLATAIVLGVVVLDQLTSLGGARPGRRADHVIGDDVGFALARNTGSAFSLFQAFTPLLAVVAIVVAVLLVRAVRRTARPARWSSGSRWCSAARSATSSTGCSGRPASCEGAVVDFVHVGSFPTFNVADSAITIGAVLIVIWAVRTDLTRATRASARSNAGG